MFPPPHPGRGVAISPPPPPPPLAVGRRVRRSSPLRPLVEARTWKATLHLLVDLPLGIALFTVAITMLSLSVGLIVLVVGVPVLLLTVCCGRWFGTVERLRARVLLGLELPAPRPLARSGTWGTRVRRIAVDRTGWKGLLYGLVMLPWGITTFTTAVVTWTLGLSLATFPIYGWAIRAEGTVGEEITGWLKAGLLIGSGLVGLAILSVTPGIIRLLAAVDRRLIVAAFGPGRKAELAERVVRLTESRDASVEGSAQELRRIERDLHDGAQQRLVGLAMELGLAKERLEHGNDPQRALESVTRAHEEAKGAIGDLRNLVRGIHPAVLSDRGLDAALSAVIARSPIPVELDVDLATRPSPAIEAAAYFVVSEALANVAKHARATAATVTIGRRGDRLVVRVTDDGRGGAVIIPGGGLAGLRDRVAAVEGRLRIASPIDGPTLLEAELPCGS